MIAALALRALIGGAIPLVLVTGFFFSAGPAYLRIDTGGERYDDFVIEPVQEYARFHSSKMVRMETLVVASEEDLTIPEFATGWTFATLLVSAFHPEFLYAWTGKADSSSDALNLSPLRPKRWTDYLEEHGEVSLHVVANHLDLLLTSYVRTFEVGEPRRRLRRYIPGLRALVQKASWLSADSRYWRSEDEARADLERKIQSLSDMMQ